jgi:hypothetical protein
VTPQNTNSDGVHGNVIAQQKHEVQQTGAPLPEGQSQVLADASQRLAALVTEASLDDMCCACWGLAQLAARAAPAAQQDATQQQRLGEALRAVSAHVQATRYRQV